MATNPKQIGSSARKASKALSTAVRRQPKHMGMVEEVPKNRLPAPAQAASKRVSVLSKVARVTSRAAGVAGLALQTSNLNSGEDEELAKRRKAASARSIAATTDPRRLDNGARRTQGNNNNSPAKKIVQTATQSAAPKPLTRSVAKPSAPVASVDVTPSAAARADDRPKRTVFQTEGTKVASAAPQEAAPDEASIMKKYGVSNLKQLGLAVSNAERKANPSGGAFSSFQRFTEGNIDQAGSAAYNKYGEGYGKSVVEREIAAFKKKKGAK